MEYGRAAVHIIVKGIWPKDFRAEVEGNVGHKELAVDPPGVFHLMKGLAGNKQIIEEERSRRTVEDRKQDWRPHQDAGGHRHYGSRGSPASAGQGNSDGSARRASISWECTRCGERDIGGKSAQQAQNGGNRYIWAQRDSRRGLREKYYSNRLEERTCTVDQERIS